MRTSRLYRPIKTATLFCFVVFLMLIQIASGRNLSASAQQSIVNQMQRGNAYKVYQFDREGSLKNTINISPDTLGTYSSFDDLLKSNRDRVGTCKNPKPTPPEGCVLCEDGRCLCTTYKFKSGVLPPP